MVSAKAKMKPGTKSKSAASILPKIDSKHIVTSVVGGALLFYAYKKKSGPLSKIASLVGTSLLGRGLGGVSGAF